MNNDMESIYKTFEVLINSFTNADELHNFVTTLGLQDIPSARFRLFQLRNPEYDENFVNEELSSIFQHLEGTAEHNNVDLELALEYVKEQEGFEKLVKSPSCFDKETNEMAMASTETDKWEPSVQVGSGEEPQPGPSYRSSPHPALQYTIRKKSEKTYAKYAAVDRTYQVKLNAQHKGQKLQDTRQGLYQMFDEVLDHARGNLKGNDLGRVVLHHESLNNSIIVPLQSWDQLNANTVMETVEKELNSNEALAIDESFDISVGSIDLPKGSGSSRLRITKLTGKNNSLVLKKSIVTIENKDMLCMSRAIAVSWAKLKICSPDEWKEIAKNRQKKSNLQLILQHRKVPDSYLKKRREKKRDEQRQLAVAISQLAGIALDRPASLNDVMAFEEVLRVRVMVISARLGNKFITSPSTDERPCIYIYLMNDNHFHAITSITGFFCANYFCNRCLKHYDHKERHGCKTHCIICKSDGCVITETSVVCTNCNMSCRSPDCYKRHLKTPVHNKGKYKGKPRGPSQCEKWWKCPKEEHQCGEYYCSSCQKFVFEDHLCYIRAMPAKEDFNPRFIFFYFECTQDQILECQEG
ncbi:uncharacterized protein LOC132736198 [Ruditapes philippinarum]|uniref:uncharacterized protein LOC132736198 n=1 Tax=Ruditapes philippinarum TaxID=129788 RepID=UPI00295BAC1F|nr:uncharacterized protein LOC132736198 [Ruditapes philippinarum]